MTALFADDLPRPARDRLSVYLLGPGVGESIVVVFPDGRSMVVDGCEHAGRNLPAELLDHLGLTSVDAVVLTHPDLDHVRGMADIIRRFKPQCVFRYPAIADVRKLVAAWCQKNPRNRRYQELRDAC